MDCDPKPALINGERYIDDRGNLKFVNSFDLSNWKRFYQVENFNTEIVRAFHGHQHETKGVYVVKGVAIVIAIPMTLPVDTGAIYRYVLSASQPRILVIPPGYANGFRALEPGTIVQFFSTKTVEESKMDDVRYNWDIIGKEIWEVKNR